MKLLIFLGLVLPAMGREINTVIVGGSNADIANHPHQLSLRVFESHSCGASLISTTRAVTAAHCGASAISVYTILGGTTDRTITECSTCVTRSLTLFAKHPDYSDDSARGYPNDVAVLGFEGVTYNANLQAIALATPSDDDFAGLSCVITGWGRTSSTSALPTILQQATMTVLTNTDCVNSWSSTLINDGHICIKDDIASSCNSDSGGPLVCGGKLAGATSWGVSSCSPSYPSVYSRISYFYDWIVAQ